MPLELSARVLSFTVGMRVALGSPGRWPVPLLNNPLRIGCPVLYARPRQIEHQWTVAEAPFRLRGQVLAAERLILGKDGKPRKFVHG